MPIDVNGVVLSSTGTILSTDNGATNWFSVDSNGIMKRPQTPYMRAQFSGQGSFYRSNSNPVTFGSVDENVGSCWNNSTGYWTCPVGGYYFAQIAGIASGAANGVTSYGYFYIDKNSATYIFSHWNTASVWDYVNLSAIVQCAAGDTIRFRIQGGNGSTDSNNGFYGAGNHGCSSIGLIL